jgi:hypothetical protein
LLLDSPPECPLRPDLVEHASTAKSMAAKNWPVIIFADLNIMDRHIDCL